MAGETTPTTPRHWSQKTGLLAFVVILTVAVVGTCSYLTWNMFWSPEAIARKNLKNKRATKPRWSELTATQRDALAPLAREWDQISPAGKKKWLQIGDRIALMNPDEKQRAQQRLQDWVKLTPEQRKLARANYALARKKLAPNEKMAQWQNYQQLTEEQRKELATAGAPSKNNVVNPPASTGKDTAIARSVKSASRDELEKSVQPAKPESAITTPSVPTTAPPPATAPVPKSTSSEAAPV